MHAYVDFLPFLNGLIINLNVSAVNSRASVYLLVQQL